MRKFTLTLAERIALVPVIADANVNLQTLDRALNVLRAIDFTEEERQQLPRQGTVDLNILAPKEIYLEDAEYEWLLTIINTFQGWKPRTAVQTMRQAVNEAETIKPKKEN